MDKSIRLIFQFHKEKDEISVVMVRLEQGDWYLFPNDKRSAIQHTLLYPLLRSINWNDKGVGVGILDLPEDSKSVYFNKNDQFKFKNRKLVPGNLFMSGVCSDYLDSSNNQSKMTKSKIPKASLNNSQNKSKIDRSSNQLSGQSSNGFVINPSVANQQSILNSPPNLTNVQPTFAPSNSTPNPQCQNSTHTPTQTPISNYIQHNTDPSTNSLNTGDPMANSSNVPSNLIPPPSDTPVTDELEQFNLEIHNVIDYIDKFEKKYYDMKSRKKFQEFAKYMPEELKKKVMSAATKRITWNSFSESFAKELSEQHLDLITKLNTEKFELGRENLIQFVEEKFRMYDKILIGVPENIQIIQIITLLPRKYSKTLYFNLDDNRAEFIDKLRYFDMTAEEEEESGIMVDDDNQQDRTNEVPNSPLVITPSAELPNQNSFAPNPTVEMRSCNTSPLPERVTDISDQRRDKTNCQSNEMEIEQPVTISNDKVHTSQADVSSISAQNLQIVIDPPITPPSTDSPILSTTNNSTNHMTTKDHQSSTNTKTIVKNNSTTSQHRPIRHVRCEKIFELINICSDDEEDCEDDQLDITRHRVLHPNHLYTKKPKLEL